MLILGLDTETQGLDASKDRVTEWGLVLWDSETKQPVRISGFLVKVPGGVSNEIEKLTGITNDLLEKYGVEPAAAMKAVQGMVAQAEYLVAHNKDFDKAFYEGECARLGLAPSTKPWVDTRVDLPPVAYTLGKSASLKYMACDHNFIYPAHRAVNDVLAMLEILGRYDVNETIRRSQTPNLSIRAVVDYDARHLAKEAGFHWQPDAKLWTRQVKADELDNLKLKCNFPIVQMKG
jgi:DNA polymerase III subunit epsilon